MNKPSFNEAAKMWDLCDSYACESHRSGWTWKDAVKYIQDHWDDEEFNVDYEHVIEEDC